MFRIEMPCIVGSGLAKAVLWFLVLVMVEMAIQ